MRVITMYVEKSFKETFQLLQILSKHNINTPFTSTCYREHLITFIAIFSVTVFFIKHTNIKRN